MRNGVATATTNEGMPRVLGRRIRDLRKAKRLTLQQLSQRASLSAGYLSLIERDLATPSIKALHDIAEVLGVNIGWFFPDKVESDMREAAVVVRQANRRALKFGSGIRDELLCPDLSGRLELLACHFAPGSSSGDEAYSHDGEEAGVVVEGQLDLWIDGEVFRLKRGDSFHFESRRPHRYRNPGSTDTLVIWAITPPSY